MQRECLPVSRYVMVKMIGQIDTFISSKLFEACFRISQHCTMSSPAREISLILFLFFKPEVMRWSNG